MSTEWHYKSNGQENGPITAKQLKQLAASGHLSPDDLVRKEGMSNWTHAKSVKGLFAIAPSYSDEPPPLPPRRTPPAIPEQRLPPSFPPAFETEPSLPLGPASAEVQPAFDTAESPVSSPVESTPVGGVQIAAGKGTSVRHRSKRRQRSPIGWIAAAACALVVVGGGVWWMQNGGEEGANQRASSTKSGDNRVAVNNLDNTPKEADASATSSKNDSDGTPPIPNEAQGQQNIRDQSSVTPKLVSTNSLPSAAKVAAYPDLTFKNGQWYCVFREGSEANSPDGILRVVRSTNAVNWQSSSVISLDGRDLRDPKLTVTPDDTFMLTCSASRRNAGTQDTELQSYVSFSSDGTNWSSLHPIGAKQHWLWRPVWHQGVCYCVSYSVSSSRYLTLYTSKDGRDFDVLVPRLYSTGSPSEAALIFLMDGSALCVARRDGTAVMGKAQPPYTKWSWQPLNRGVSGPCLLQMPDGRILLAGRLSEPTTHTCLCWLNLDNATIDEFMTLPSGGYTGHPSLHSTKDGLWAAYYSSHEGKTGSYVARLSDLPIQDSVQPQITPALLNVEELNSEGQDNFPWLSPDGLTIYWARKDSEYWIWTARRPDPASRFGNKKRLLRGHSPVLTGDGLEMFFVEPESNVIAVAFRPDIESPFSTPQIISELPSSGFPRSTSVSPDGLELYFDRQRKDKKGFEIWITRRENRMARWNTPELLQFDPPHPTTQFAQAAVTPDGLQLFCVTGQGSGVVQVGVVSRESKDKLFGKFTTLDITTQSGRRTNCFIPRFVPATDELFVISSSLFDDDAMNQKRKIDIWVVKDFVQTTK